MLTLAYIVLTVLGCAYVMFAAIAGHADHGDGGADGHGGHDAGHAHDAHAGDAHGGHYGVEGTGKADATALDAGSAHFHFPFFSPLALSTVFASLGAWGLMAKFGLELGDAGSLAFAIPAALVSGYAVSYLAWKVMSSSRGTSTILNADFAGAEGEVVTPIPAGGLGEVTAFVSGQRFTAPAREAQGGAVARGTPVRVERMVGSTLVVSSSQRGS